MSSSSRSGLHLPSLAGALLLAAFGVAVVRDPDGWRFIDGVNLLIHEGGHPLFSLFGEFMAYAGGTLMQLLVPLAFTAYFLRAGQRFGAAATLCWTGESLFNVARYAADARARLLPLVGGDGVGHDWTYMLARLGLLESDLAVARGIRLLGALLLLAGVLVALRAALSAERRPAAAALQAEDVAFARYLAEQAADTRRPS